MTTARRIVLPIKPSKEELGTMVYIIETAHGETREHQRHEVTRRTARLDRVGIAYTVRMVSA